MTKIMSIALTVLAAMMFVGQPVMAQQRSRKRGVCWDEKTQMLTSNPIRLLSPGVSWLYTWGESERNGAWSVYDSDVAFVPMCWNGSFNETKLRNYLTAKAGKVKRLLAFNEPNLGTNVGGSAMTPQQAANAWQKLEGVANDFGLEIVAPALNFSGDKVGGRVWQPFEWYDEFFRLVPNAKIDYLAFHSYMNYYSAVDWVASRYFYSDSDTSDECNLMGATNRALYPNLVRYMDNYRAANGHYPKMFLTEFCSWETTSYPYKEGITQDFQIDQMTQKVQKLEKSELVAAYAWFMANPSGGETEFPFMSLLKSNTPDSQLSDLGKVYVYMSSFDMTKYYAAGETIMAKDYIDASTDNMQLRIRPNSDAASDIPLQVEWQLSSWATYLVDVPADGIYTLRMRARTTANNKFNIYQNSIAAANKLSSATIPSTSGNWQDVSVEITLKAGRYGLLLQNVTNSPAYVSSLAISASPTAVTGIADDESPMTSYYSIDGIRIAKPTSNKPYITKGKKYIHRR
ncbi:MAG: glycosyl hydrolase [Prevotella sp.]